MPTVSFVKIYGPPVLKAVKALEKIAVGMPEVCIMDSVMLGGGDIGAFSNPDYVASYFHAPGVPATIDVKRCKTIISKSGEKLGEHDFFFEWFTKPSMDQLNHLIERVDEALTPLGCKYTITTKK
jgi:hypothetical protein